MTQEVHTATLEMMPEVVRAVESVFGEEVADHEIERFRKTIEADRVIYIEDEGEVVAGAGAYTFKSTVPGAVLPTGGVTLVAVKPSHRRQGLLRKMMVHQLHDIHERGEPIATLWASEGAIYGRFGYGLASVQAFVDIARDRGRFADDPGRSGRARMLPLNRALDVIRPIYDRVQARTPGMFERNTAWWETRHLADPKEWRDGASPKYLAVWEDDSGVARAYTFYRIETGWSHDGPIGSVQLWELIAEDVTATREMWRFLFGVDLVDRVKSKISMLPPDSPLLLMLEEPRRLRAGLTDALWLRVVDVQAALQGRGYAADGDVVIELRDAICPWNEGRWAISARDGRAEVTSTDAEAGLEMDVSALGAAYLGTFSFAELQRAGRVQVNDEESRRALDALFHTDIAPYCPEIF